MHTPIKFYVKLPADLFRGGTSSRHRFDYLRTMPPRKAHEVYDVKIHPVTKIIDHRSGGLSLFNAPDSRSARISGSSQRGPDYRTASRYRRI